jgi:hypothetical protein
MRPRAAHASMAKTSPPSYLALRLGLVFIGVCCNIVVFLSFVGAEIGKHGAILGHPQGELLSPINFVAYLVHELIYAAVEVKTDDSGDKPPSRRACSVPLDIIHLGTVLVSFVCCLAHCLIIRSSFSILLAFFTVSFMLPVFFVDDLRVSFHVATQQRYGRRVAGTSASRHFSSPALGCFISHPANEQPRVYAPQSSLKPRID